VLSVDVWQGHVMIEGWKSKSAYMADGFIKAFAETPFAAIVVTDIAADVSGTDASLGMIEAIARSTRVPVIASGIVKTLDDISRLQLLGDISGALVGRALFNRTVDLGEALSLAKTRRGQVAEFI
jgi:phosphoribosylformimino-5-aminoimidazole carboxamide ribotide isomerase